MLPRECGWHHSYALPTCGWHATARAHEPAVLAELLADAVRARAGDGKLS
jgi:hypothetical protein